MRLLCECKLTFKRREKVLVESNKGREVGVYAEKKKEREEKKN